MNRVMEFIDIFRALIISNRVTHRALQLLYFDIFMALKLSDFESFKALKISKYEIYRALRVTLFEIIRALKNSINSITLFIYEL